MSAHFEIVTTDAEQSHHVRVIADNGEPILTSENLEHRANAERVVLIMAEMFGLRDVGLEDEIDGTKFVTYDGGFSIGAVVRYVDERSS